MKKYLILVVVFTILFSSLCYGADDQSLNLETIVKNFITNNDDLGIFATMNESPDWDKGKKREVYTTQGKFMFVFYKKQIIRVYNYGNNGKLNKKVYNKVTPELPDNILGLIVKEKNKNSKSNSEEKNENNDQNNSINKKNKIKTIKAFGSINFKDSPEEVEDKIEDSSSIKTVLFGSNPHIFIQKFKYFIYFDYYKEKLYRIKFESINDTADYFNTKIKNQRNVLYKTISRQYGKPDYTRSLSILNMENGYIKWSHLWDISEVKKIKLGLGENNNTFDANLWIEYLPLVKEKEAKKKQQNDESIENNSNNF